MAYLTKRGIRFLAILTALLLACNLSLSVLPVLIPHVRHATSRMQNEKLSALRFQCSSNLTYPTYNASGTFNETIVMKMMGAGLLRKYKLPKADPPKPLPKFDISRAGTGGHGGMNGASIAVRDNSKLRVYDKVVLEPWRPDASFSSYPRITYYNGHRGCNEDMRGVLSKFKLNFNVLDPRKVTDYGMEEADAQQLVDKRWVRALCQTSDVIIVADTMPDARPLLLSLLDKDEEKRCNSNIIVELTNRFDWMVTDTNAYHEMLRKLIRDQPKNLHWTANNPFEEAFFKTQVGTAPNITLLRSLGAWNVDREDDDEKANAFLKVLSSKSTKKTVDRTTENSLAMIEDVDTVDRPMVDNLIDYYCMPIVKLSKKYGGPEGLLKYKGFVHFPYQVSVMKFYENIAMGVPQVIPTPRLLRRLANSNNHHLITHWINKLEESALYLFNADFHAIAYDQNHLIRTPKEYTHLDDPYEASWTELADFYRSEFTPFVYYFDSFEELAELVNLPRKQFDWKNVRVNGPKYYAKVRRQSMDTWMGMFHGMGYTHIRESWHY